MNSYDPKCEIYWSMADVVPLDEIVRYWCGGKQICMEAKKHALLSALERGEVEYRRSDGKDFNDPVYDLYQRRVLLVVRESFLAWAGTISSEQEKQNLKESLEIRPRVETTYLNIIGALLLVIEEGIPDGKKFSKKIGPASGYTNETTLIASIASHCQDIQGLSVSNLSRKFPEAKRSLDSQ